MNRLVSAMLRYARGSTFATTGVAAPAQIGFPGSSRLAAGFALIPVVTMLLTAQARACTPDKPVGLGSAANFAVLGASTVTNTGETVITGDLGLSPGTSVTGFPPGTVVGGAIHVADTAAAHAQVDLTAAYNDAASRTPATTIGTELGGTTVKPGVYNSAAGTFGITGNLTLDAQGDPDAVFIFQAASTLITASSSAVILTGGAKAANVIWQVGSSATLGTGSSLAGNVLALTSITVTTGVNVNGRVLARNGAVTLDTNAISRSTGALSINVPGSADPGSAAAGAANVSGPLGEITVTDTRGDPNAAWTATVDSTDFTTGGATAPETIAKRSVNYSPGPAINTTGSATFTPGTAGGLGSARIAFSAADGAGNNSATWNPTITVALPADVVAGTYTGAITHSAA
ncbi:ice-binding family protein [Nonomuraea sp. NPDC049129]|uniref:ice-binding family protein n=1 Tax=Nonomuraea sp. NPDC049129 TaxID=3155272 RepID=UPI003401B272